MLGKYIKSFLNTVLFITSLLLSISLPSISETRQIGSIDPATPIMQTIVHLDHDILFFVLVIVVFVIWMLPTTFSHFKKYSLANNFPTIMGLMTGSFLISIFLLPFPDIFDIFLCMEHNFEYSNLQLLDSPSSVHGSCSSSDESLSNNSPANTVWDLRTVHSNGSYSGR